MQNLRKVGSSGEEIAKNYLENLDYYFIEKNFETPYGEIDLIMQKGKDLYFIEVKMRNNDSFGFGDDSISPKKIEKLRKSIEVWISLKSKRYIFENTYLDGIIIDPDGTINRYEIL